MKPFMNDDDDDEGYECCCCGCGLLNMKIVHNDQLKSIKYNH